MFSTFLSLEMRVINLVMVTERRRYFTKIRMFCIFLFIGMMMGLSVLPHVLKGNLMRSIFGVTI
jgi:hypothetical protein